MRNLGCAVFCFLLLSALLPVPLRSDQVILVDPENVPEEITVIAGEDFHLALEGKGWYLKQYDRSKLTFRLRSVEPSFTIFTLHAFTEGMTNLVFSLQQRDIPLEVVIVPGSPSMEESEKPSQGGVTPGESEETGGAVLVLKRVEALRKWGSLEEPEEVTTEPDDTGGDKRESQTGQEISQVPREEKVQAPQPEEDELYYVDDSNRVVKVPRVHEDDYYNKGSRTYRKGEYEEAAVQLNLYLDRCEMCKKRDAARLLLAEIAIQNGDEEEALVQLGTVVESGGDKSVVTALYRRAGLLYSAERFHEAARDYERIYEHEGGGEEVFQRLGDIHYQMQQKEEALRWYEEGIERGEVNDETVFRVATLYDSPGSYRDIEKAYRYYKLITVQYHSSPHYEEALRRVQFFEKNFFDYY